MHPALIVALCVLAVLLLNFGAFVYMIRPSRKRREQMRAYHGAYIAHRGLHDDQRPENSMSAFAAAVEAGYGIELDVRVSKDGEVVILHDDTLDRMTGMPGPVSNYTVKELSEMSILGTKDGIPTLREVLELVDGRVPLVVELKEELGKTIVTDKTAELLREYNGPYVVESFNPMAVDYCHRIMPDVPIGFLSSSYMKQCGKRGFRYFAARYLLTNIFSKPDFIAYAYWDRKNLAFRAFRRLFPRTPLVAWTLTSPEEEKIARRFGYNCFIFENYIPDQNNKKEKD